MTETRVARVTGIGALVCLALSWLQFPLWVIGEPPSVYDGAGYAATCSTSAPWPCFGS